MLGSQRRHGLLDGLRKAGLEIADEAESQTPPAKTSRNS